MIIGPTIGKLMFNLSSRSQSVVEVEGHRMVLASKGKYPPIRMAMGEYETETTRLFQDHIKPGMSILDIGAHAGYYTLLADRLTDSGARVFSFLGELPEIISIWQGKMRFVGPRPLDLTVY